MAKITSAFAILLHFELVRSLILLQGPASLVIGSDRLQIVCSPSNGTENWSINIIQLFSNKTDILGSQGSKLVSMYYDIASRGGKISWQDATLQSRATAFGNIDAPSTANLTLIVEGESTQCLDAVSYRCEITAIESGSSISETSEDLLITPFANPDQIENIKETLMDGYHDGNGRFDYGTSLELFCNATVGIPQQSTQWCVKYYNETSFRVYPNTDDVTHNPSFQESRCQYRQDSTLNYNVSDTDTMTNFLCEVTNNSSRCQLGAIYNNFSLEVVYARVDINATPEINIYKAPIDVNCSQATSGEGLTAVNMMQLYKTFGNGNKSLIFSVIFDAVNNQSQIDWSDPDMRNRTNLSSDITSVSSAHFRFNIPAEKTLCEDEATYTCILKATNVKGENISDSKDIYVKTNALPAGLDTINVTTDNIENLGTGTVALGTRIQLFCNGLVGSPAQNLTWCIKRLGDTDYKPYNGVNQSEAILVKDCQHQRNSTLVYNVTSADASTTFLCEAGRRNAVCGTGYAKSSYTIYAVDIDVSITAPETVTSRKEDLKIDCQQSASGQGEFYKTELSIYRYVSTNASLEYKIVSLRHNGSINSSFVIWHDEDTRQRGEAKGVVYETKSAFLSLTLNESSVTCLDESWYKCEMKVLDIFDDELVHYEESFVNIKVIPDHMLDIKGTVGQQSVTTEGAFESGSTIELTCNSTVGDPPEDLFWCIKQYNDTGFSLYSSASNESQSQPSTDGPCQFRRTSTLLYNVTKQDLHTTLMCTAGSNVSCDQGFVNSTFTIYVVDTMLNITTTDSISLGEDDFVVACNQTGSQNGLRYPISMQLSRLNDTSNSSMSVPLLSFIHNTTTGLNHLNWFDQSLVQRSSVIGDATGYSAFLKLIINANNTKCEDKGTYVCTLSIMDLTGRLLSRRAQEDVNIKTLPRDMQAITARFEDTESSGIGAFQHGTSVYLSCTSKVGDPPQNLTWCLKRDNDDNLYELIDSANINQTEPVSTGSCQFQRTSLLLYNVTSKDNQTVFSCQAGENASCGSGYVQTFFNLYAVDTSLSLDIPQTVIPGQSELTVICQQRGSVGGIQYISTAVVYKDTNGQLGSESSKVVTVTYDQISGSTHHHWYDVSVQRRANLTGNITSLPGMLTLHIEANLTVCEDAAQYRCEFHVMDVSGHNLSLTGDGIVSVKNIPGDFKEITGTDGNKTSTDTGTFESGSLLKLTCSANVGLPPMGLTWCMKLQNQTKFIPFPNETQIAQSEAIAISSCQFSRISVLAYKVSQYDKGTQFMCVVATNTTCDYTYGKAEYTLYAVDTRLTLDLPQTLIPGQNEFTLMCTQTGSVEGIQYISRAEVYKDTNGQLASESSKIVTVTYDQISGSTQYNWHDVSVQRRAKLTGNITSLPGLLTLQIEANLTVCEDAAQYRCEFHVVDVSGHNISLTTDGIVSVKNIPGNFKEITGTDGNKTSADIGVFESGSLLKLTCTANVGLPPMELTWCMKQPNETKFIPFPNETQIAQSEAIATSSCQFSRLTLLSYYVSNNDDGTQFICVVQTNATCDVTYGQATYALYAVDVDVETVLPTSVVLGQDSLEIECRQRGMGYGFIAVKSLILSKKSKDNSNSNWTEIVSLEHKSVNFMTYRWNDMDLERRATLSGSLLHPRAFLHLTIPGNFTKCEDDVKYGCHLEALDLTNDTLERFHDNGFNLISPPDWMNPVIELTSNRSKPGIGVFEPGDIISLLCNSSVGDPPQNISWCSKRENELFYIKLDSIQTDPVNSGSCQNSRFSYLSYNVSYLDTETTITCLTGNDCENGGLNHSFVVYTLDADVDIVAPPKIKIKQDEMEVSCLQQGAGRGLVQMESKLTIYKDTNGELETNQSRVVSVYYDFSSQSSVVTWHDSVMKYRASASGEITRSANMSVYLILRLDANSTNCNDSATYRCELRVPDVTGTIVVRHQDKFVDKEYIPDYISDITGLFENRTTVSVGVYKPEDTIRLTCHATAGYPPMNLTWCAKGQHDTHFFSIQNNNLSNLENGSSDSSCKNMRTSTLTYTVTSNDTETQILCKVGGNMGCSSHILNSSFTLYTVDSDIIISSPDKFVLGIERVEVSCHESGTGRAVVRMSSKIHLMKRSNTTGASNHLVTVEYDLFSRSSIIKWHDKTLRDRTSASGEITPNPLKPSYLRLAVDSNSTICEDAAYYECKLEAPDYSNGAVERLSGKTVDIEVLPDAIENIQVHTANWLPLLQRSFEIGSQVQLTCTGTVGYPARELRWCIKRKNDPDYEIYRNTGINQSNPELENGCQYRRSSTLQFNISSQDEETKFLCTATNSTDICGGGYLNSTVTLYAIDVEFTINITTKNVTLRQDRIAVTCQQQKLGIGLTAVSYIHLYRNNVQIVSVERRNIIVWHDTSVQSRASVIADVTSVQGAYLTFVVLPLSTTCADAGTYRCQLSAIDASNQLFIGEKETTVEMLSLPDTLNINLRTSSGSSISGSTVGVGATLLITCSGSVGKPIRDIEWCIKISNDSNFVPYVNSSHITTYPPSAGPSGDCEFEGSSVLEMIIPNSFLNLQVSIMCETGRSACGTGLSTASLTFTVVTEGDASELSIETSGISSGAMTGIAVGILAAIVGPSAVLLIWKRKRVRHFLSSKIGDPGHRVEPKKTGNIENTVLNKQPLPPISTNLANGK